MKVKINFVFVVLFFFVLFTPIIFMERKHDVNSAIDNRKLVEFPIVGTKGFFSNFEKALNDRIGFRNQIITAYIVLNDKLFRTMEHPTYTYGKNGYVFFKIHKNVEYDEFHQSFVKAVKKMSDYCEDRGIKFYFVFDPEKLSVYRKFLPRGVKYNDVWVDKLISSLESEGVCCVNNSALLIEKSDSEQVFNRKYDAGHWNDLGMFYSMNNLFSRMHSDFPIVNELTLDDFNVTQRIEKSLPVSKFPIKEQVPVFRTKVNFVDNTGLYIDGVQRNPSFPHFHYFERNDDLSYPKLLVFQGSYLNRNAHFIISNASVDIGIHNYQNVLEMDYYVNMFQPDAVIFEVAEYVFADNYFSLYKMNSLDFYPALSDIESFIFDSSQMESFVVPLTDQYATFYTFIPDRKVRYAWLTSNEKNFDLKQINENLYAVTVLKELLNNHVTLFVQYEDGNKYSYNCKIISLSERNILTETKRTNNITQNENGTFTYSTVIDENNFSYVVMQLYNPRNNTYNVIHYSDSKEKVKDVYFHNGESGEYSIYLRGNTNLEDEWIQYSVTLEHNKLYLYEYFVDNISSKSVTVSNLEVK